MAALVEGFRPPSWAGSDVLKFAAPRTPDGSRDRECRRKESDSGPRSDRADEEFVTPTAQMTLADDLGAGDVERGKQRRRAVAAVIARTALGRAERHRQVQFLETIEVHVPADPDVHLILDKYGTHKTPRARGRFVRHPRFHRHFTPTIVSWLNVVERWFALLSQKENQRGAHRSVHAPETAIREYLAITNDHRSPSCGRRPLTRSLPRSLDFVTP